MTAEEEGAPPIAAPPPAPVDADAVIGRILGDYSRFLARWENWVEEAADEAEATRRMKARNDAARAALGHLEQFRKVAAGLGLGRMATGPRTLPEWRALMPPGTREERCEHDEHGFA